MSSVHIYLNTSTSQSSRFFNFERKCIFGRKKRAIQIIHQRVLIACLNVGTEAPNSAGKTAVGKTNEVIKLEGKFLVGTYARTPVVLEKGKGCKLYDVEGREYLDMSSGIAVIALGHGDADWLKAVVEQASTLTHVSNIYHSIPQVWAYHQLLLIS